MDVSVLKYRSSEAHLEQSRGWRRPITARADGACGSPKDKPHSVTRLKRSNGRDAVCCVSAMRRMQAQTGVTRQHGGDAACCVSTVRCLPADVFANFDPLVTSRKIGLAYFLCDFTVAR